ncbi:MAG: iron-containing alcohol dehydrogenase [Flammeovirgaceae bacterium]
MIQQHTYHFPTDIRFGAGVIKELPDYLKKNNLSKPFIVTDPIVKDLPHFQAIISHLESAGFEPEIFAEIQRIPQKNDAVKGSKHYRNASCDAIISMGGGTCSTVARAIALSIHHTRDLFDYEQRNGGEELITDNIPHFITVPFTAGTGNEAARSCFISDDETKEQKLIYSKYLIAKQVFADPELTMNLPPNVTASTGMDALAHNIEAFLATGFHPMCDGIALAGISMISSSIEKATFEPTIEARSKMLIGSLMGAVAYQKGLGIVHALAHPLSSLFEVHHGTAIATMMPYGLEFNAKGMTIQFQRIGWAMGIDIDNVQELIDHLLELNRTLELPTNIQAFGVQPEDLENLAEMAVNDFCNETNPKKVSKEDYIRIYRNALHVL